MKDLLERVLKQLPSYLPDLFALLARPKASMLRWVEEATGDLTRPLVFVAMTVAIGFLIQIPQLGKEHDFMSLTAGITGFKLVSMVVIAAIIHGLFVAAGGRAGYPQTLSIYFYLACPLYLAMVLIDTASLGAVRALDPELAALLRRRPDVLLVETQRARDFAAAQPGAALGYQLITSLALVVTIGWFVACWGAFRQVHGVSRLRSAIVGSVAVVLCSGAVYAMTFVMFGMFGAGMPPLR